MFFNVEILCMQKGGKLAKIWIAATRGTGSFPIKEILAIDLQQAGDEIARYITSTSAQPRNRFSLVLSSKLICGLARLYNKKATIYLNDVFKFTCQIKVKPTVIGQPSLLETSSVQEKRLKQKRPKKKIADSNTPDVNVKITPDEEVTDVALKSVLVANQAPEELITLREAALTIQRPLEDEELFGIGTIADVEVVERALHGTVEPTLIQQISAPQTLEVQAVVHPIPTKEKRPRSPEEKEPEKRKRQRTTKVQEEVEIDKAKTVEILQPEVEPPVAVAPKEHVDVIAEEPAVAPQKQEEIEKEVVAEKRRAIKAIRNKAIIVTEPFNTKVLYRQPYTDKLIRTKRTVDFHSFEHFRFTLSDVGDDYILESIGSVCANDENVELLLEEMALHSKSRDSLAASISSWRARLSGVPMKDVSSELMLRASEVPSLRTSEVPQPMVQIQEEKMIPIEEEVIQQIDVINGYDKGMTTIVETTLPPAGYINHEKEAVVDIAEVEAQKKKKGKATETSSEKRISYIGIVKVALQKWNWNKGFPAIEDVCHQPINRFNISVTFSALLELHKQKYAFLTGKPESLELEHIEKGPEFY